MDAFDLIRRFEGYRSSPYWDVNAYRAGYGSDTVTLADGRVVPISQGMSVTTQDAQRDLERRVTTEFAPRAAAKVGEAVWAKLSEPQRAALTSITYNYGDLPDSVAAKVMSGDMQSAALSIRALGSHNDGVNAKRRTAEASIFAGGALPAGALPTDPQARGMASTPQNALSAPGQPQQNAFPYRTAMLDPAHVTAPTNALTNYMGS